MKISYIELAGFRGFKSRTRFDIPAGFAVLNGRNGVGKSTVLDAVDFALTGSINKFAVREAKGGGLDEHIWWVGEGNSESAYVAIGFVEDDGHSFTITRSRERGLHAPLADLASRFCADRESREGWAGTLMQTTLIRDETIAALSLDLPEQARFAAVRTAIGGLVGDDRGERTSGLARAANEAKAEQQRRLAQVQAEVGRILGALTEARSMAARQPDVAEAHDIIEKLAPDLPAAVADRAAALRSRVAERKRQLTELAHALLQAEHLAAERTNFESLTGEEELATAREALNAAREAADHAEQGLREAQGIEVAARQQDVLAAHLAGLVEHGETLGLQEGHCPLCNAPRTSDEFAAAIGAARAVLKERGTALSSAKDLLATSRASLDNARTAFQNAEQRLAELETRRATVLSELQRTVEALDRAGFSAPTYEPDVARAWLVGQQEDTARLERAVFILEASSAHDRVTALEASLEEQRKVVTRETTALAVLERATEAVRQIQNAIKEVANEVMTEQFDTVMPLLKELFLRLRPHADWRDIQTDFGGRVRASLNFTVGDGRNPQFLFSSGQRRAAGLAFLLAMHLSRPWCRLRSLLLDDPVQHIDDYRALNLVEVLSAVRRTGRQVIVAVEDPALADLLCRRLRSTTGGSGRRFDLALGTNGSTILEREQEVFSLHRGALKTGTA